MMSPYKGTYILIGAAAGYISGGNIYHRNKAIYVQKQGWQVFYISCCYGKIYINGLEQFLLPPCTFICKYAYLLPRRIQNNLITYIEKLIPCLNENIVIETGTDFTAYWGELLAERLHARHIVVFLDESNEHIKEKVIPFYYFKFQRNELACISSSAMQNIFGKYWHITEENAISLPCVGNNSLEEYNSSITNKIPKSDYNIGYIGRLEKNAFLFLIDAIRKFAQEKLEKTISLICFGDVVNNISDSYAHIDHLTQECPNVKVYVSGLIFPIPKEAVCKCDIFVSTAGSALVSFKAGVPTVKIDELTNKPNGFILSMDGELAKCPYGEDIINYLNWFFDKGYKPEMEDYVLSEDNRLIESLLKQHDVFLEKTTKGKKYFDFKAIKLTPKEYLWKILMFFFGQRMYRHLLP